MKFCIEQSTMEMNKKNIQLAAFLGIENNCLSSKYTFFWKYVFMPAWILSYWPAVLACAWNRLEWQWITIMFIPWVTGSVYLYFVYGKIKKISISGSKFIVSNYRKEITIDMSEIDSVGGSFFLNPELVWLNLKSDSDFGRKIIFAPEQRSTFNIFTGITKHSLVAKLNSLCVIAEDL